MLHKGPQLDTPLLRCLGSTNVLAFSPTTSDCFTELPLRVLLSPWCPWPRLPSTISCLTVCRQAVHIWDVLSHVPHKQNLPCALWVQSWLLLDHTTMSRIHYIWYQWFYWAWCGLTLLNKGNDAFSHRRHSVIIQKWLLGILGHGCASIWIFRGSDLLLDKRMCLTLADFPQTGKARSSAIHWLQFMGVGSTL